MKNLKKIRFKERAPFAMGRAVFYHKRAFFYRNCERLTLFMLDFLRKQKRNWGITILLGIIIVVFIAFYGGQQV